MDTITTASQIPSASKVPTLLGLLLGNISLILLAFPACQWHFGTRTLEVFVIKHPQPFVTEVICFTGLQFYRLSTAQVTSKACKPSCHSIQGIVVHLEGCIHVLNK